MTILSENDDLILGPWLGLAGASLLAGVLKLVQSADLGLTLPLPISGPLFLFLCLAGTLYGACQLRVPVRGLVAVGVFYGVFLWVLTNIVAWLGRFSWRPLVSNSAWLLALVSFSSTLALFSIIKTLWEGGKSVQVARH